MARKIVKQEVKLALNYERYLAGDDWCCPDAKIDQSISLQVERNTGAHYWIELHDQPDYFYCKYCFEVRWKGGRKSDNPYHKDFKAPSSRKKLKPKFNRGDARLL